MAFSTGFIRPTRASMPGSGKSHIKTFSSFSTARIRSRSPSTARRLLARGSTPSSIGALMPTLPSELHLVSICSPMFDAGPFILDAIASARAQTYQDVEIIVVDNCSRDGSFELAEEAARDDPRIRVHRNASNLGMQRNFGRCLELARGEYIKFLCADDVLEHECVARLVDVLDAQPSVALVVSARRFVDEQLHEREVRGYSHQSLSAPGEAAIRRAYVFGNVIGEPTAALFRRAALVGISDYYAQLLDLDMWFRVLEHGGFAFVAEPLCKIRMHPRQFTHGNIRSTRILDERVRLFRDYSGRASLRLSWLERLIWDLRLLRWWRLTRFEREPATVGSGLNLPWQGVAIAVAWALTHSCGG